MKIALIGHGKMGRAIEEIALARGHEIVSIIDVGNRADLDSEAFLSADIAIEFTCPAAAAGNVTAALSRGVSVVSGSTGWDPLAPGIQAAIGGKALMWSSNFSLGVNLFFAVNRYVASLMARQPQYAPSITEIHHVHKLDHPSGTAITLAQEIAGPLRLDGWTEDSAQTPQRLLITSERRGEVPGTHTVRWDSPVDSITLTHEAHSRQGFALGAVTAAEWLAGRSGFFTMDDYMNSILANIR